MSMKPGLLTFHRRHLLLGNNAEALRFLRAYLASHPDHATTKKMVEPIEAGDVEPL